MTKLILEDGSVFEGTGFGSERSIAGEVVFNTGMVGYPETFSDPSYTGEILVLTYPLIGNYGVGKDRKTAGINHQFESNQVHISGLIVSDYSPDYHHWDAAKNLGQWLSENDVPAISGIDTRALTQKLREKGTMLGKIEHGEESLDFYDPNQENLVAAVSVDRPTTIGDGEKTILLVDCGCKHNIIQSLLARGLRVRRVPWDYDISNESYDGVLLSNGPGDPKVYRKTIQQVRNLLNGDKPVFGICLGHQLIALAAGADTFKLKYGHRSQNQPVIEAGTQRCLVTSQNHGFAVENRALSRDWEPWFSNLNDGTNEGIRHVNKPFMSVQFHPEAAPGPVDAGYLFDEYVRMLG